VTSRERVILRKLTKSPGTFGCLPGIRIFRAVELTEIEKRFPSDIIWIDSCYGKSKRAEGVVG